MTERFEITDQEPGFGSVYSEIIIDKTTGKEVCEDIYDTVQLLNKLNGEETPKPIYEMNPLELIQNKDQLLETYAGFMKEYRELESTLLLETDFKAEGCTNEKQRTAFINKSLDVHKHTRQVYENQIDILNDLIKLRMMEVKE